MKKRIIFTLLILVLVLVGCEAKSNYTLSYETYFNTHIKIELYDVTKDKANEAYTDINYILESYHNLTDRYYNHGSIKNIKYINDHQNEEIVIDEKLFNLIEYSITKSNELNCDEYFNVLVGSVSNLYKDLFDNHQGETIDESLLPDTNGSYNFNTNEIILNKTNYSIIIKDGMSIDLGGIAKGYVSDIIIDYLNDNDIKFNLFSGESTVYISYGNSKRENNEYIIGFRNPTNTNQSFYNLSVPFNMAITVSGDYQKYFIVDDRIYSHILDINTKESVVTDIRSSIVISDDASKGDILSTSLFMMGSTKAKEYLELNNLSGILYTAQNEIIKVNMDKYE